MTSRSSYLAKWKENVRRRGWTFLLCGVTLAVVYPVLCLMYMTNLHSAIENGTGLTEQILSLRLLSMQRSYAGQILYPVSDLAIAAAFAVLFAIQGFSWLYSRRRTDLYLSVPVSEQKRFWLLWGNGIGIFGFFYLVKQLLCWGIGLGFGLLTPALAAQSCLSSLLIVLAFAAMYQLSLLAALLTGNVLTALLGSAVLFSYEAICRFLLQEYLDFFQSYSNTSARILSGRPWITPFCSVLELLSDIRIDLTQTGLIALYSEGSFVEKLGGEFLYLAVCNVLLGLVCYFLYRVRRTESYGHSLAFPLCKPVLEFFLLIPFALLAALVARELSGANTFMVFVGLVLASLLGHGIIRLIYERDLKAVCKGKAALFIGTAVSCLIVAIFHFDLAGYDRYVPKAEEVKRVSVSMEMDYGPFRRLQWDGSGGNVLLESYLLNNMRSEDPATIEAVIAMAQAWQEAGRPGDNLEWNRAMGKDRAEDAVDWWVARYELADGRSVYRRFLASPQTTPEAIEQVMRDEAFWKNRYQINDSQFAQNVASMKISYQDGKTLTIYTADQEALYRAYLEDFASYGLSLLQNSLPCGELIFRLPEDAAANRAEMTWEYPVYDSFENTRGLLAQNGIESGMENGFLQARDVSGIRISAVFNKRDWEQSPDPVFSLSDQELDSLEDSEEYRTLTASFQDPEQIGQILKAVYPVQLCRLQEDGLTVDSQMDSRFDVQISLSEETAGKRYDLGGVYLIRGKVPDFVIEALKNSLLQG